MRTAKPKLAIGQGHPWLVSVTVHGHFLHFDPADLTAELS